VIAAVVGVSTRILARAAVAVAVAWRIAAAAVVAVAIVAIAARTAAAVSVAVVAVAVIIVVVIVVIMIAVRVVVMSVVVIAVIMIVMMIVVMITMVIVRTRRLVVRSVVRLVVRGTVTVVMVVSVSIMHRMTLYPIRRGVVIYSPRRVPEVVRGPRLVPYNRGVVVGAHIERTPQYRCRCHCNYRGCRRSNVHIVVVGSNCYPRTMEPLDSHLVGVVHVVLHVIYVAAVYLGVGGYRGNHRQYNE